MSYFLTKSKYLHALQCLKRLWIEEKYPHRVAPMSAPQQRVARQGIEVGFRAHHLFPRGVFIASKSIDSIKHTQHAIKNGSSCIFEAAFVFDNVLLRCDVLEKAPSGSWNIVEVKATTSIFTKTSQKAVKKEYLHDLAIQKYVLLGNTLPIHKTSIMYLNNRDCVFPDLSNLFTVQDLTAEVEKIIDTIPRYIKRIKEMLSAHTEPAGFIGIHCHKPHPCPVQQYCWRNISPKKSIFTIPRLSTQKKIDLVKKGIFHLNELPADYGLTLKQQAYIHSVLNQQVTIKKEAIRAKLSELQYPLHFFDFETDNPAIPRFEGLKPYQKFPFQYSCHIWFPDNTIVHREYLHIDTSDPRLPLLKSLLSHISETGSVVVYNVSFERSVLERFAETFPEYAPAVRSMIARLWDQLEIFRKYYHHPDFGGSCSIKNVLPVLAPSIGYKSLAVQKGDEAQTLWETMIHTIDEQEKRQMIEALKAYCKMDTLAMVEIHKVLKTI